jgi:hypothetical protein
MLINVKPHLKNYKMYVISVVTMQIQTVTYIYLNIFCNCKIYLINQLGELYKSL